jgi:hypothetical protein
MISFILTAILAKSAAERKSASARRAAAAEWRSGIFSTLGVFAKNPGSHAALILDNRGL